MQRSCSEIKSRGEVGPAGSSGRTGGGIGSPPCLLPPHDARSALGRPQGAGGGRVTRRSLLAAGGALALGVLSLGTLPGCGGGSGGGGNAPVEIYVLSGRGRRVSRAALAHAANKRFRTPLAADLHRAHPGDNSRIVRLMVSRAEFRRLFPGGAVVADLRLL